MAVLLPLAWCPAHSQPDVPPAWLGVWDFLIENVCIGPDGRVVAGVTPLDLPAACPSQRKIALGERLPYRKRDWPGLSDRAELPLGYQQSDSFPVSTSFGLAAVQTYDFGDRGRAFDRFDAGDGGQVAFLSLRTAAFGLTQDGGAGLQFFLGPTCAPVDGWVIVDATFPAASSGATLARITRDPRNCPGRLGHAFTRWHVETIAYRTNVRGRIGRVSLETLVSDHFGGRDIPGADHLERMYFTRQLGYTRWERWQNLSVHDRAADRAMADALAASQRCAPGLGPPSSGTVWGLIDCREWTQVIPPTDEAGDPPTFWIDRLARDPATRAIFAP